MTGAPAMAAGAARSIVLASASVTRQKMLAAAGLSAISDAAHVDESAVKAAMARQGATARDVATALAEMKARQVSGRHPGALVIGADQILECEGRMYDKPSSLAAARLQLLGLRGRTHVLVSAAIVVQDGRRLWHETAEAQLTVRAFSDEFLDDYLTRLGEDVCRSVGAYQLEGLGVQLFSKIDGDFFTILGMPLLPLLSYLRGNGAVLS